MRASHQFIQSFARTRFFCATFLLLPLACLGQTFTNEFKNATSATVETDAKAGKANAQYELGWRYMMGRGGKGNETNYVQAAEWFFKAANQNLAIAQHNLGGLYFSGNYGVPRDYTEAFKWYTKAAEQGFTPSQSFLGWAYASGKGVTESFKESIKWYQKAANEGDREAQLSLGILYLKGEDLNPDYIEAYKWVNLAAAMGHTNAIRIRRKISLSMTPDQIAEGQRRAHDFSLENESQTGETNGQENNENSR